MIGDMLSPNLASMNICWKSFDEELNQSFFPEITAENGKMELPNQAVLFGNSSDDLSQQPTFFGDSSNDLLLQQMLYSDSSNDLILQQNFFSDFPDDLSSQPVLFGPSTSSSVGLTESTEREGFKVPKLVTNCIPPDSIISCSNIYPSSESSSILSPTSSLESSIFIPHSSAPSSPTTGKFSFVKEDLFKDIRHETDLKPPESCSGLLTSENKHKVQSVGSPVKVEIPAYSGKINGGNNCHSQQQFHHQSGFCVPSERKGANNISRIDQRMSPFAASNHSSTVDDRQEEEADLRRLSAVVGVPNDNGYNWRKYGQKQVKGGEYPRSYYRCTHPGCNVKKKVERSSDGDITKIIYSGYHDHPRNGGQDRPEDGLETASSARFGAENYDSMQWNHDDSNLSPRVFSVASPMSVDEEEGVSASFGSDGKGDESEPKRRSLDASDSEIDASSEPIVVIRSISEVDIMDDGYRWRKYGQKVVKGNQNPRHYYKCTFSGCTVRKQAERAKDDINSVITTYEGKHNHDVPVAKSSSNVNSATSSAAPKTAPHPRSLLQIHEPTTQNILTRFDSFPSPLGTFGFAGREPVPPGRAATTSFPPGTGFAGREPVPPGRAATTSFPPYTMGRTGPIIHPRTMAGLSPVSSMAMPGVTSIYPYGNNHHHQPTQAGGFMMPNIEPKKTLLPPDALRQLLNAAPVYQRQFLTKFPQ